MEDYRRKLINYFKKNINKGYTLDSLRFALQNQGYSKSVVDDALDKANKELAEKAPRFKERPKIKYEIIDEYNKPIKIRKSFFKRLFG